jgi:hypothetical protein
MNPTRKVLRVATERQKKFLKKHRVGSENKVVGSFFDGLGWPTVNSQGDGC